MLAIALWAFCMHCPELFSHPDRNLSLIQAPAWLQVIPAFEEAVAGMKPGGIRRIVVPPEIGYPDNDFRKQGPVPTTFSVRHSTDP